MSKTKNKVKLTNEENLTLTDIEALEEVRKQSLDLLKEVQELIDRFPDPKNKNKRK